MLQRTSESVDLKRRNTLIARCPHGRPRPQLVGRANSTALARRQRKNNKMRAGQRLRSVPDVSIEQGQCATHLCVTRNTAFMHVLQYAGSLCQVPGSQSWDEFVGVGVS
eukprot:5490226-Amphidinium_carterae.1